MTNTNLKYTLATIFFVIALIFVYRSFYSMRISAEKLADEKGK
jgi:K(+)-stimulated pyrophosphate-energized sodium pump